MTAVEITVTHSKSNTESLIDKPFVKITGRDDVAPRFSETFPRTDIKYIQTSVNGVERDMGLHYLL